MKSLEDRILAGKILEFKNKHNLTYQEIGKSLGVDRSYINRVVKMSSHMSMQLLIKLARYMKVPTYKLLMPSVELLQKIFVDSVTSRMKEKEMSLEELSRESHLSFIRLKDIFEEKSPITNEERTILATIFDIDLEPYSHFY